MRNALAHGNIRTYPDRVNQIKTLVFVVWSRNYSEKDDEKKYNKSKYDMIAVSPKDFHDFLKDWLSFLKGLKFFE